MPLMLPLIARSLLASVGSRSEFDARGPGAPASDCNWRSGPVLFLGSDVWIESCGRGCSGYGWAGWRQQLRVVPPETVIRWRRKGQAALLGLEIAHPFLRCPPCVRRSPLVATSGWLGL
jgi:hypothetical protein